LTARGACVARAGRC